MLYIFVEMHATGRLQAGTETVLARIKGAKKLPGVKEIMLPGEGGSARAAAVLASGVVSVEKNLYDGMKTVRAAEVGRERGKEGGRGTNRQTDGQRDDSRERERERARKPREY